MPGMQQTLPDPRQPALISFWLVVRLNALSNTAEGIGSSFTHKAGNGMGQFYASFDLLVSNGSDLLTKGVEGILQLGTDGRAIPSGMRSQVVQRFAYYLMSSGSSGLQCFQEQILNAFQVLAHTNKFVI